MPKHLKPVYEFARSLGLRVQLADDLRALEVKLGERWERVSSLDLLRAVAIT